MSITSAITWFKTTFQQDLEAAVRGTPYSVDLLCAIAYQETGYLWAPQIGKLPVDEILQICVGDTLDAPNRSAFPKTKAALLAVPSGDRMFQVAREALEHVGRFDKGFGKLAARRPDKFCHGFGIFQYDLQFSKTDPDYFLKKKWHSFKVCVTHAVEELKAAQRRQRWQDKTSLTHDELVFVAIAYNRGRAVLSKGFKQGHKSSDGKFYGENIDRFLRLAASVQPGPAPVAAIPVPAATPAAPPLGISGEIYAVNVSSNLRLRSGPGTSHQIVATMPPGQLVQRISGADGDQWWQIEATVGGTPQRGFVAASFLKAVTETPAPIINTGEVSIDLKKKVPAYVRAELTPPKGVLKEGQKNKSVRQAQEWLCLHGVHTGIDGDFGSATTRCVREFQAKTGLNETGTVNDETWNALVQPMREALSEPKDIATMSLAQAVRAVAALHVNQRPKEVGGANRGPWVRLCCEGNDGPPWAWCAGFVSTVIHQACFYRGHKPPLDGSVSCDLLANQGKAAGLFVHEKDIADGDLKWSAFDGCCVFLRLRSTGDWNHTGFALDGHGAPAKLVFDTIEGNTNDEGSREGFEACRRKRSISNGHYDFLFIR